MRQAALAAFVLLVTASVAGAKGGPVAVRLCGSSGCATSKPSAELGGLYLQGGLRPPRPAAFYTMSLFSQDSDSRAGDPGFFVPGVGLFKAPYTLTWSRVGSRSAAVLGTLARRVEPYSAPWIVRALVEGRPASRPRLYAQLLLGDYPALSSPPAGAWLSIELFWSRPNPWAPGSTLQYLPGKRVLFRDGGWVRLPADLGAMVERDAARR